MNAITNINDVSHPGVELRDAAGRVISGFQYPNFGDLHVVCVQHGFLLANIGEIVLEPLYADAIPEADILAVCALCVIQDATQEVPA